VNIQHKWYIIDAAGIPLGRLASEVAVLLTGKNKPIYTPTIDCGDNVIIINAAKVTLSGNNKMEEKFYYNTSGSYHGLRKRSARVMIQNYPCEMVERTIKGMLPHTTLGRHMGMKLYVYADEKHNQEAQKPEVYKLKYVGGNK
jgi:large subunit ribosomal protein L13